MTRHRFDARPLVRRLAISVGVLAVALAAGLGYAQPIPDGGPGGACVNDADCGICGWVCSWPRGKICVPSMEGDPGHCAADADCACPGQACSNGACSPPANPQCRCNSDCPAGEVCDQLLFTCHAQNAVSCGGAPYHGWDYGPVSTGPSCGCGFICAGGSGARYCQPQCFFFPPECSSDMDCGTCNWGWTCVPDTSSQGGPVLSHCRPTDGGGWCNDAVDASPLIDAGNFLGSCLSPDAGVGDAGGDAGPDAGSDAGLDAGPDAGLDAGSDGGTVSEPSGCGCGGGGGAPGCLELLLGALLLTRRRTPPRIRAA